MPDSPVRVSFYVLDAAEPRARLGYVCRLTEKVYKLGQRIHALAGDEAEAGALDDLLWTFRQGSFVPHERLATAGTQQAPVTIGVAGEELPQADLLINLSGDVPKDYAKFPRIAEIIDGDERQRTAGRQRHRYYQAQGLEPETLRVS